MVNVLVRQLEPTIEILERLVEEGPDELWFRQGSEVFHIPTLNKDVTPDLDKESTEDPTKAELGACSMARLWRVTTQRREVRRNHRICI